MKSIIRIFIVILFITQYTSAQTLSGGITAGVTTGSVKITGIPSGFSNVIKGNNIRGFEAGLFARASFDPFYIKPSLLLNYRNGAVDIYKDDQITETSDFTVNRLLIPVMLGFKIIGPVAIEAGPVYNYLISSTKNLGDNDIRLMKSGFGYRVGAALEIGRVNLSASYQGIKNNSGNTSISSYSTPNELIFGIGVRLSK